MAKVQRPRPRKDEKEKKQSAFTVEETQYILQCPENKPLQWRCYVYLLLDSGARRGEICALEWSDIDFKSGAITISRNLLYTKDAGVYLDTPKSGKSRVVDSSADTLALLRQLRHTSASLALTNSADVVSTSERLGHSSSAITLRMYAHSNPEAVRDVGNIVRNVPKAENE